MVDQVCALLGMIRNLLDGVGVSEFLKRDGIPVYLSNDSSVAQLLYSYLVQWIGEGDFGKTSL